MCLRARESAFPADEQKWRRTCTAQCVVSRFSCILDGEGAKEVIGGGKGQFRCIVRVAEKNTSLLSTFKDTTRALP